MINMNSITSLIYPEYKPKRFQESPKVLSDLTLQMMLYFNIFFCIVYYMGMLTSFTIKLDHNVPNTWKFVTLFVLVFSLLSDALRLYLGYIGNLIERIPELSSFMLMCIFPQIFITLYFVLFQRILYQTFVFEYSVNSLYSSFCLQSEHKEGN
jgi:hypothetical protein